MNTSDAPPSYCNGFEQNNQWYPTNLTCFEVLDNELLKTGVTLHLKYSSFPSFSEVSHPINNNCEFVMFPFSTFDIFAGFYCVLSTGKGLEIENSGSILRLSCLTLNTTSVVGVIKVQKASGL